MRDLLASLVDRSRDSAAEAIGLQRRRPSRFEPPAPGLDAPRTFVGRAGDEPDAPVWPIEATSRNASDLDRAPRAASPRPRRASRHASRDDGGAIEDTRAHIDRAIEPAPAASEPPVVSMRRGPAPRTPSIETRGTRLVRPIDTIVEQPRRDAPSPHAAPPRDPAGAPSQPAAAPRPPQAVRERVPTGAMDRAARTDAARDTQGHTEDVAKRPARPPAPTTKPAAAHPPTPMRADARRADQRPSATAREAVSATPPVIHVTIGRVDVRATPAAPVAAGRTSRARTPALSLDDYLRQRQGGAR